MIDDRPPARSRRGGAAIWIGLALLAILALSLFGFAADDPTEAPDAEAVIVDD